MAKFIRSFEKRPMTLFTFKTSNTPTTTKNYSGGNDDKSSTMTNDIVSKENTAQKEVKTEVQQRQTEVSLKKKHHRKKWRQTDGIGLSQKTAQKEWRQKFSKGRWLCLERKSSTGGHKLGEIQNHNQVLNCLVRE